MNNTNNTRIDIGRLAKGDDESPTVQVSTQANEQTNAMTPANNPAYTVVQSQDIAWVEATQGLQRNLIRSLQDYKMSWSERRALAAHRGRVLADVTEHYVNYLREEAKMASQAAISARDSLLRQELAKLRAKLFVELAEITGTAVVEIERMAQGFSNRLSSPAIQQAYARFVMNKIFALLEQPEE